MDFYDRLDRSLGKKEPVVKDTPSTAEIAHKERQEKAASMRKKLLEEEEKKRAEENRKAEEKKACETIFDDPEQLDALYSKALKFAGSFEIDLEEYKEQGVYSEQEIEKDMQLVKKFEAGNEKNNSLEDKKTKKIATIFEAVMAVGITHAEWYGNDIKIYPPSKFDDFVNGIDAVLEFENAGNEEKYMGLGVDVTFGSIKGPYFENKLKNVFKRIDDNKPAHVKYFQKYDGTIVPEFEVPKVIISGNFEEVRDLAFDFKNLNSKEYKEKLRGHKIRGAILGQVMNQCEIFSDYARKTGKAEIASLYEDVSKNINSLASKNPQLKMLLAQTPLDRVALEINRIMEKHIDEKKSPQNLNDRKAAA